MLVAADGETNATLEPPPLQHNAAVCGGHALAEPMHTHAPPDLGLISTLWHLQTPIKELKHRTTVFRRGFQGGPGSFTGCGRLAIITEGVDSVKGN